MNDTLDVSQYTDGTLLRFKSEPFPMISQQMLLFRTCKSEDLIQHLLELD